MPETNTSHEQQLDIAALYPELTEEQRKEAAYYLGRYLDLVQRIFERVHRLTAPDETDSL